MTFMSDDLRAEADTLRIEDGSRWRPNPERAGRRGYPSACRRIVSVEGAEAAARTMDEWRGG
ncbi:MAG: hypothetical protein ACOCUZ_00070, partial [bacterium]